MLLTLQKPKRRRDLFDQFGEIVIGANRTGDPDPYRIVSSMRPRVLEILSNTDPAQLENFAGQWAQAADIFPPRPPGEAIQAAFWRVYLPSNQGWLRPAAEAYAKLDDATRQRLRVDATPLTGLVDAEVYLRSIISNAAAAQDGAMDLRTVAGGMTWYVISAVLDWLRDQVGTPAFPALVRDFQPMLVLVADLQTGRQDGVAKLQKKKEKAGATAAAAGEEAALADTEVAFRKGADLSHDDLLRLARAQSGASDTAAAARTQKGRKVSRGKGKKPAKTRSGGPTLH